MVFLILSKWPNTALWGIWSIWVIRPMSRYPAHLALCYKLLCLGYYGFSNPAQMARYPAIGVFSPFGQLGPFALNFRVLDFMFHVVVARYPSHLFCYNFLCFRCVSFLSRWPDTLPPLIWSIAHLDFTNLKSLCLKDTVPKPSHHQKKRHGIETAPSHMVRHPVHLDYLV